MCGDPARGRGEACIGRVGRQRRAGAVAPWLVTQGRTITGRGGGLVGGMWLGEIARIVCPTIGLAGPLESPFRSRDPQTCRRAEKMLGPPGFQTVCFVSGKAHALQGRALRNERAGGGAGGGTPPPCECEEAGPQPACLLRCRPPLPRPQTENAPGPQTSTATRQKTGRQTDSKIYYRNHKCQFANLGNHSLFEHESASMASVGIGCSITARDGAVSVISIVPTGPAALCGKLAVGDVIVKIDGTEIGGDK
jgi:hypothetical protein